MTADAAIRGKSTISPGRMRNCFLISFAGLCSNLFRDISGVYGQELYSAEKSMNDLACSLTDYLNLTAEEKYQILAQDSRRQQCEMIAQAIYEFIEISNVSAEAQNAQKDDQEQLYREIAIKNRLIICREELDEMHPENVSDVRRFEKKLMIPA